jgi:hypothetical protein
MASVLEYAVDLTTAKDRFEVVKRGMEITDVYVAELAGGVADVILIFGQGSASGFRNIFQGQSFECCPHETDGLYITAPAVGGTLRLAVTLAAQGGASARGGA